MERQWPVFEWVHECSQSMTCVSQAWETVGVKQDSVITQRSTEYQQRVADAWQTHKDINRHIQAHRVSADDLVYRVANYALTQLKPVTASDKYETTCCHRRWKVKLNILTHKSCSHITVTSSVLLLLLILLLLWMNMIKCHQILGLQEHFTIKRTYSESSTIQRTSKAEQNRQ